uniref:Retrotransposon gag domain-containing protein n=1 Tax=Cannabis sativa TaxID=3483 RepID=A0A803NUC2_CANSA
MPHTSLTIPAVPTNDDPIIPQACRRDFELSVGARNKTVFLKGTLPEPPIEDPLHHHWFCCNQMVMSWILHSVTPKIKSSIMFLDTSAAMWTELHACFDQGNGPRTFELRETLITLRQGDDSVSSNFTKLKCMWNEIQELRPRIPCTCAASIDNLAFLNQEQVLQFLTGLNESFFPVCAQILLIDPFPSFSKVFSMVIHEERQRKLKNPNFPFLVSVQESTQTPAIIAQNPFASAASTNPFLIGFPPGYGDKKKLEAPSVHNA